MDENTPLLPKAGRGNQARTHAGTFEGTCSSETAAAAMKPDVECKTTTTTTTTTVRSPVGHTTQILLLCYARLMEPLAFYSLFPYIAQMTQLVGDLPESDIGFYSGVFESIFSAVQALVLIFWGAMVDRVGGKTMLIYSLWGMAVTSALFGFATSLWQMALFRCLTGLMSGGNVVIRAMIGARCTTSEEQTRAFGWYSLAGNLALFIGPLLGGALAEPAGQYPGIFGGLVLFERFPYMLPGIAVGAVGMTGAIVVSLFVDDDETVSEPKVEPPSAGTEEDVVPAVPSSGLPDWVLLCELAQAPGVAAVLRAFVHVMLIGSAFMAVGTLTLYTSVEKGGLGFSAHQIAMFMTVQGIVEAGWLLLLFPPLHRRMGTKGILYVCAALFPLFFADYIAMNAFLRNGSAAARIGYRLSLGAILLVGPGMWIAVTAVQLGLQEASPSRRILGTLNAVAETCSSLVRAVVPAVSTSIYAIGIRQQLLGGYLIWIVLILLGSTLTVTLSSLPARKRSF